MALTLVKTEVNKLLYGHTLKCQIFTFALLLSHCYVEVFKVTGNKAQDMVVSKSVYQDLTATVYCLKTRLNQSLFNSTGPHLPQVASSNMASPVV